MSLRSKVLIFVLTVSAVFALTSYLVQRAIMLPGFEKVEREEASKDVARCVQALRRDCEHLSQAAADYAAWDDTYEYVIDRNSAFESKNLLAETFRNLRLNLLLIVDLEGSRVWGEVRNDEGERLDAEALFNAVCRPGHVLTSHSALDSHVEGILPSEFGPLLVGSRPIITSQGEGPIRGALIMGRLLDADAIAELSARTRVALELWPVDSVPPDASDALHILTQGQGDWTVEPGPPLWAYTLRRDIYGQPALLIRIERPPTITTHGRNAAHAAVWMTVGGGAATTLVMWFVLALLVVQPLTRLTEHAARVGEEDDLTARLNMRSRDEIGVLARAFDTMVDRLAESRAQMLAVARHAGMAEVAVDVLHNVGNVLNTVNTSASLVSERLRTSELPTLSQAADLMLAHREDLGAFITRDERGRHLPAYLAELAKCLSAEQAEMQREMQILSEAIDHIRSVVAMQQVHGKSQSLLEPVEPAELVEHALGLGAASLGKRHITLERHFEPVGPVLLDKHKVLQILVNLLSNATHALSGKEHGARVAVRIAAVQAEDGRRVQISVSDNGMGIAPENIERIFTFGFSTRRDGHGFGLHSAANLAREMGGSLQATSPGPGQGATFVLDLPLLTREAKSPAEAAV